ncbi:MAG TPA: ABC transporter permease subunit [Micromonosporaceae bacterium]|nr:ABC transporter permease subunit [Micromonosporaceae bacterium]
MALTTLPHDELIAETPPPDDGASKVRRFGRFSLGGTVMAATILVLGAYVLIPIVILLVISFNTAPSIFIGPARWGFANWVHAWTGNDVLPSLYHSFTIWFFVALISLPVGVGISLLLARTNMPFSRGLEFCFWIAYIFPPLSSAFGWIYMMDPDYGFLNKLVEYLPFVHHGPFNVFSVPGMVFVRLMSDGIAYFVILLTPAFRNMDGSLEEASRVSGYSGLKTMFKVTTPMLIAPIVLVSSLQLIKIFQGFEVEYMIGSRFHYFVYSTLVYNLVRVQEIPNFSEAVVLASITLLILAIVIPLQHWVVNRRYVTTVNSSYKPGLLDIGPWRFVALGFVSLLVLLVTVVPTFVVVLGSFMTRVGFFGISHVWTWRHWQYVFDSPDFYTALRTTLILAVTAAFVSPLLFSLFAYLIVRTKLRGRLVLDTIIWSSAAMPGILLGLGLLLMFLLVPGLKWMFGTIWPLMIVMLVHGKNTGTNVIKGVMIQLGGALEESARVSGAGWFRTYFRVVLPVMLPTMVLVGMLSFVGAANSTAPVILLASQGTTTLSILSLQIGSGDVGQVEAGGIISIIIMAMSLALALPARILAQRLSLKQNAYV